MPVTFKTSGLSLGRKLQKLSTEGRDVARAAIKREVENLIQEGFDARVEPRQRAWEPRKRSYPWPILEKTGKMRESFEVDAQGANIIVKNTATDRGRPYPLFHQKGWMQGGTKQAARQSMPIKSMPSVWRKRLDKVVLLALQALR